MVRHTSDSRGLDAAVHSQGRLIDMCIEFGMAISAAHEAHLITDEELKKLQEQNAAARTVQKRISQAVHSAAQRL